MTTHSLHSSGCHSDDVLSCHTLKGSDVICVWSQPDVSSLFVPAPSLSSGAFVNCLPKDSHFHIQSTIHACCLVTLQLQWWIMAELRVCYLLGVKTRLCSHCFSKVRMYDNALVYLISWFYITEANLQLQNCSARDFLK